MDEVQRLLLQIEGREKLEALNASLATEMEFLQQLLVIQKQGVVGVNPAQIQAAAEKVVMLNQQITATEKSTKNYSGTALQLGYVLDDLVNTSGSWERHLAAISNNIPGLVMSLGLTGGVAGVIGIVSTALIALAPVATAAWHALVGGESADVIKARLKDLQEEIARTHEAYLKLKETPTNFQEEAAKGARAFLAERPHADQARMAVALGISADEASAELTDKEKAGIVSDEYIEAQLGKKKYRFADKEKRRAALKKQRADYLAKIFTAARQRNAERTVNLATQPGDEGDAAREKLFDLTKNVEGFEDFNELSPEAVKAAQESHERFGEKNRVEGERRKKEQDQRELEAQGVINNRAMVKRLAEEKLAQEQQQRVIETQGSAANQQMVKRLEAEAKKRKDDHRKATKHRDAAEAAEYERNADLVKADADKTEKERPMVEARKGIGQMGAEMGLPPEFNAEQVDQMASSALANVKNGMTANQALFSAIVSKMTAMNHATGQFTQQLQGYAAWMNQQQMGGDNSGQFSAMPSMPNMGFGG